MSMTDCIPTVACSFFPKGPTWSMSFSGNLDAWNLASRLRLLVPQGADVDRVFFEETGAVVAMSCVCVKTRR